MTIHELKTDSAPFLAVKKGLKTCELRRDDRNYRVGDILCLRMTQHSGEEMRSGAPLVYVGDPLFRVVTHLFDPGLYGLGEGYCILSLRELQ